MMMSLEFDLKNVQTVEFAVGRDEDEDQRFYLVPVDKGVQRVLVEMVDATWQAMEKSEDGLTKYEPSEKYATEEYVYLPLKDDIAISIQNLHTASNMPTDSGEMSDLSEIFCYVARFVDRKDRRLTAVRRAAQFKGLLKSKGRLIRWIDDTLRIVEQEVFKLDKDFDFLVDDEKVHILRPSGFESVGRIRQEILNAVPKNISVIQRDLPFVDFDGIEVYSKERPRAARYLASIRDQVKGIGKEQLKAACQRTGIEIAESNGKIIVPKGSEMRFLELLDRRIYDINLVEDQSEVYRAGSRRKINE